jgi:hypothetical protein
VGGLAGIAPNLLQFDLGDVLALEDVSVEERLILAARELDDYVVHLRLE